jgi:hypothetical protein
MAKTTPLDQAAVEDNLLRKIKEHERLVALARPVEETLIKPIRALCERVRAEYPQWLASMDHPEDLLKDRVGDLPGVAAFVIFLLGDNAFKSIETAIRANYTKESITDVDRARKLGDLDKEIAGLSRDLVHIYEAAIDAGQPFMPSPHVRPEDFLAIS